jgi:chromosomal replication initiation ATPase DnaA
MPLTVMRSWRHAGLTLLEIGHAMGGLHYAAVSEAVRRLEDRRGRDRELQRAWSAAVQMLNV